MASKSSQRQRAKRRKKLQRQHSSGSSLVSSRKMTASLTDRLLKIFDLIDQNNLELARLQLAPLVNSHGNSIDVIKLECVLADAMNDGPALFSATRKWLRLKPQDLAAKFRYGLGLTLVGAACAAFVAFQEVVSRSQDPDEKHAAEIKLEECREEAERRVEELLADGFIDLAFEDGGVELLAKHELVLQLSKENDFPAVIPLCRELIDEAPNLVAARNTLALAHQYTGDFQQSLKVARDACELAPDNSFSEALLGKILFLSGEVEQAQAVADGITTPAQSQASLLAQLDLFSFLGLDEKVLEFIDATQSDTADASNQDPLTLHFQAVAKYRTGEHQEAILLWRKNDANMPSYFEATLNLEDIEKEEGHAAWASSGSKWLPKPFLERLARPGGEKDFLRLFPKIVNLLPAMLDRGDPFCRTLALSLAERIDSKETVRFRKDFALSNRGPFDMRFQALSELVADGHLDSGPHHFFGHDGWLDVEICSAEISFEAVGEMEDWERPLAEEAYEAIHSGEYDRAEELYLQILERSPEKPSVQYNLATVWQLRDGPAGQQRAARKIREIHKRFPDYAFAITFAAVDAADAGDFDKAHKLLRKIFRRDRLHFTEARGLYMAQCQVAIKQGAFDLAKSALTMLESLSDDDDESLTELRFRLEAARQRKMSNYGFVDKMTDMWRSLRTA